MNKSAGRLGGDQRVAASVLGPQQGTGSRLPQDLCPLCRDGSAKKSLSLELWVQKDPDCTRV